MNMDIPLSASGVAFRYADAPSSRPPALADIDLAVRAGRMLHLLGANGSGRSTLLAVLAGLAPAATGGTLGGAVRGSDGTALVHADPYLNLSGARDTVRAELAFGLECRRMSRPSMADRVEAALDAFALDSLAHRDPTSLSGGEAARLAIACQWVLDPAVLLVDEVDAQLDAAGAAAVRRHLADRTAAGAGVVWAGARLDMVFAASPGAGSADAVVLAGGRIVAEGGLDGVAGQVAGHDWGVVARSGPAVGRGATDVSRMDVLSTTALAPDRQADLEVAGLCCAFDGAAAPVLDDITCRAAPGETVAVLGPNGGGKSTLARAITGLHVPAAGIVRIGGRDVGAGGSVGRDGGAGRDGGRGAWRVGPARGVALSVQRPERMLFRQTVADEVAIGLRWCGAAPDVARAAVGASLAACGLADRALDHPHDLQPSERRWLALAAAVALRTPVLVLDEPTAGFDARDLARFARFLSVLRAAGRTVVWVTHDHGLARALADRALMLVAGRVEASGSVVDVIDRWAATHG